MVGWLVLATKKERMLSVNGMDKRVRSLIGVNSTGF